ncbi:HERV-H LTR-associating protein 2 [Lampris incognitus]|uniref:HERV-H LTR-associating protein 2 n=1 Tax=Lampris incognitus TaxID=2546036 RepID=UPI0024B5C824|nr:HERV-H LTR-associating protein 2 [Lampris incognitus]
MTWIERSVILPVILLAWPVASGDTNVTCVYQKSCVLPCTFPPAGEELIHWILLEKEEIFVHSYYNTQDQLQYQNQRYRQRTSVFHDQIPGGNASLRLTTVTLQDEGRYRCYTSTVKGNMEVFIHLEVEVPLGEVDVDLVNNTVTCSSKGIYPKPKLKWSTQPPSKLTYQIPILKNHQELYDISSSLDVRNNSQFTYICSVSNNRGTRKTFFHQPV